MPSPRKQTFFAKVNAFYYEGKARYKSEILTSSKLVLPTPLAPSTAALSEPRYHGVSLPPSIVIRYAEYHLFWICICSIAANDSICDTLDPGSGRVAGDVDRPAELILCKIIQSNYSICMF